MNMGKTLKWNATLANIIKNGKVGKCPYCKSEDTDYIFWEHDNGRGCLNVWCNTCNERVHADCGSVPKNRKHISMEQALAEERERNKAKDLAV